MRRPGECQYFAYKCGDFASKGSKYCDYHRWLVGVFYSLLGSCVIITLMQFLTVTFPGLTVIIGIVGLVVCGVWIYLAVERK